MVEKWIVCHAHVAEQRGHAVSQGVGVRAGVIRFKSGSAGLHFHGGEVDCVPCPRRGAAWACCKLEGGMGRADIRNASRKTCKRWNEAGDAHALTFSCFRRQPFLDKDRSRRWMIDGIERARERYRCHIWAYVIMPEHVHLLLWPTEPEYSISAILNTLKQSVAKRALTFVKRNAPEFLVRMEDVQPNGRRSHRFWQRGGGYDRNVTEPKTVWTTMDYIHANPVRRGLCRRPTDWPWSSALEWEQPGEGVLSIDRESVPRTEAG